MAPWQRSSAGTGLSACQLPAAMGSNSVVARVRQFSLVGMREVVLDRLPPTPVHFGDDIHDQ